ncbi:MAG: histidine phosphatase family protein [Candidatus Methylomirabilis sp.]|nr:histidine phosphatase family protein [Deltaproteobacteria bacterium]
MSRDPAPLTLYLIRHGRMAFRGGAWSIARMNAYVTGREQAGLSARGAREAERVADRLAAKGVTRIYSSAFQRAKETAVPLAKRTGIRTTTLGDLGELNPGAIEDDGFPRRLIELLGGVAGPGGMLPPGIADPIKAGAGWYLTMHYLAQWLRGGTRDGEGVREGYERVVRALNEVIRRNRGGGRAAVFTHGYFILLAVAHAALTRPTNLRALAGRTLLVPNGSVTKLAVGPGGELTLAYAFDVRHLRGRRARA